MAKKIPPIPKVVPIPTGYRRAKQDEITTEVLAFSRLALSKAIPIGKQQTTVIEGPISVKEQKKGKSGKTGQRVVMAITEWHYDNHPSGSKGDPYWHPGISVLVPTDVALAFAKIDTAKKTLFAGEVAEIVTQQTKQWG
jgi:hypothetical protein